MLTTNSMHLMQEVGLLKKQLSTFMTPMKNADDKRRKESFRSTSKSNGIQDEVILNSVRSARSVLENTRYSH